MGPAIDGPALTAVVGYAAHPPAADLLEATRLADAGVYAHEKLCADARAGG